MDIVVLNILNSVENLVESNFAAAASYLVLLNMATFAVFGIDKMKAKRGSWRISENTLLGLSLIGGSVGGFTAMRVFRHKTKHKVFSLGIPVMIITHLAILLYVTF